MAMKLNDLLRLLEQAQLSKSSIRHKACERIQTALSSKYKVNRLPTLIMRLPFTQNNHTANIRAALLQIISATSLPQVVQTRIAQNLRVVTTRRKSISDILYNARLFAKRFYLNTPVVCACGHPTHRILLPEDFDGKINCVLSQNSRNIPYPSAVDAQNELLYAFRSVLNQLSSVLNQSEANMFGFSQNGVYDPASCDLNFRFQSNDRCFSKARKLLSKASELRQPTCLPSDHPLSLSAVNEVKHLLHGFILLGLDKNGGKTAVICPVKMRQILIQVYFDDTDHYQKLVGQDLQISIVDAWNDAYISYGWRTIARFLKSGSIPYAYALPKNKDLSKYRTIVSYANHPLKFVYRVTQRAVVFLIKMLPDTHFTLFRTQDALAQFSKMQNELSDVFGQDTAFLPMVFDVKEMFTGLHHAQIRRAIQFLIEKSTSLTRSKFVRVPRDKARPCVFGKSANIFEVSHVSFQQIYDVVSFDIRSAVFSLGNTLFIQKSGAPIGGVLSTAEALATCAFAEYSFHSSCVVDNRVFRVCRYVDDIWGVCCYKKSDDFSLQNAQHISQMLQNNCYPGGLVLKQDEFKNGTGIFLETRVSVTGNKIYAFHHSKNLRNILESGKQKFYTMQSSLSFSSRNSKRGVIVARLMAISKNSPDLTTLFCSVAAFFVELKILGYGTRILKQACMRLYFHSKSDLWLEIPRILLAQNALRFVS
jgi:hypothetical protein